jgi:AMP phosphorylase
MRLKVKIFPFLAGTPICMIHKKTAEKMSIHVNERVNISKRNKTIIAVVDTAKSVIKKDEIAVSDEIVSALSLKKSELVEVRPSVNPISISYIKKKLDGYKLENKEIKEIIKDISTNELTEIEIAFFVAAVHSSGMTLQETKFLTKAMVETGKKIKLNGKVIDKHSIGGIAGNRTTPILVPICAAAGLVMPKTSSRAITSAAGTADTIETLAKVDFTIDEIKKIIRKTNACFVWGGALGLAPVDDKIIKIEKTVNIDSTSQLLASILSKKISVGSKYILIDIPYGPSAKVNKKQAISLKEKFLTLGKIFGLHLKVILTNGTEPIGNGIGPTLEMIDILKILRREDGPVDLEEKSIELAAILLELSGKVKKGKGKQYAASILDSGLAFKKFKEIILAQKGHIIDLHPGDYFNNILATNKSRIKHIDNKLLNSLARFAGCPEDKRAGVYIYKKAGSYVQKGEKILTIYAESGEKLNNAIKFYKDNPDIIELY